MATGSSNEVSLVRRTLTVTVAVAASSSGAIAVAATLFADAIAELLTRLANACFAGRGTCSVFVLAVFCDGVGAGYSERVCGLCASMDIPPETVLVAGSDSPLAFAIGPAASGVASVRTRVVVGDGLVGFCGERTFRSNTCHPSICGAILRAGAATLAFAVGRTFRQIATVYTGS